MSADLVSLPFLHEPKVSTAPRALMVCYWCVNLASLLRRVRSKSPRALALKGLATNETTAQSRDCAVATKGELIDIENRSGKLPTPFIYSSILFVLHPTFSLLHIEVRYEASRARAGRGTGARHLYLAYPFRVASSLQLCASGRADDADVSQHSANTRIVRLAAKFSTCRRY